MPAYGAREEGGFGEEFLLVVFAEVQVLVLGVGVGGVEGEDVGGGFEFGDGDEADLPGLGGRLALGWLDGWVWVDDCLLWVWWGWFWGKCGEGRGTYVLAGGVGGVDSGLGVAEIFEELFCSLRVDSHGFVVVVVGHGLVDGGVDEVKASDWVGNQVRLVGWWVGGLLSIA